MKGRIAMSSLLGATERLELRYGISMLAFGAIFAILLNQYNEVAAVAGSVPWILGGLYILSGAAKR